MMTSEETEKVLNNTHRHPESNTVIFDKNTVIHPFTIHVDIPKGFDEYEAEEGSFKCDFHIEVDDDFLDIFRQETVNALISRAREAFIEYEYNATTSLSDDNRHCVFSAMILRNLVHSMDKIAIEEITEKWPELKQPELEVVE